MRAAEVRAIKARDVGRSGKSDADVFPDSIVLRELGSKFEGRGHCVPDRACAPHRLAMAREKQVDLDFEHSTKALNVLI
jgi:hypothetical protein